MGKDGIYSLSFEFAPTKLNKEGLSIATIAMIMRSADGSGKTDAYAFQTIRESDENPAQATPVNMATETPAGSPSAMDYTVEPEICTCTSCSKNETLLGSSLDGFIDSYTPSAYNVETASGKISQYLSHYCLQNAQTPFDLVFTF